MEFVVIIASAKASIARASLKLTPAIRPTLKRSVPAAAGSSHSARSKQRIRPVRQWGYSNRARTLSASSPVTRLFSRDSPFHESLSGTWCASTERMAAAPEDSCCL